MAGVVGGSTGAALAAVVMIFEMTMDYTVIIPMTATVALSYGLRTILHPQSIYTEKLARRGHAIPAALQANFFQLKRTRDVMDTRFVGVPADGSVEDFVRTASARPEVSCFLVEGAGGLVGFLTRDEALRPSGQPERSVTLADLADRRFVTVDADKLLLDVIILLRAGDASVALVTDRTGKVSGDGVCGLVTKQQIANAVIDGMELFSG
jgi:CIC family chloride channel protein